MRVFLLSCAFAAVAFAQPTITAIENNYSYTPAGLPNSGIAQGAIFIVKGTNLGPTTLTNQTFPLQTSISGVSATVTVGTTTVNLIPYYVWSDQLAFVLPSATPVGAGTLTVTVNGTTVSSPITVVPSQFGLLNLNAQGSGPAAAEDLNFQYITPTNAANPGQEIVLWGSGLGAATGDETNTTTTPGTLTGTTPVEVWIGGQMATVIYAGRSTYPGLDQVNVTVPSNVSGCFVSVYVQVGGAVSNSGTIAVAPAGTRTCSDANGFTATEIQNFYSKPDFRVGQIYIARFQPSIPIFPPPILPIPVALDNAAAAFVDYTQVQGWMAQNPLRIPSVGSCTVNTFTGDATNAVPVDPTKGTGLDAGPLSIQGPVGSQTIPEISKGFYGANLSANTTTNPGGTPYLNAGNYIVAARGGADVGAFSIPASLTAPTITWNTNFSTITRGQDLKVTWSQAQPGSTVVIVGVSTNANQIGAAFYCAAAPDSTGAGTFTVPAGIIDALPVSTPGTGTGFVLPSGFLLIGTSETMRFQAPGLDAGYITFVNLTGGVSTFQ